MIEIIKFRLSLLRERFSIYGWRNIIAFTVLVLGILIGGKALVSCIGQYSSTALLLTAFFCCACGEAIFPQKVAQKRYLVQLFFDKVNANTYERYLRYRNFVYVQFAYIFLLFPVDLVDMGFFSVMFVLFQGYLLLTTLIRHFANPSVYHSYKWGAPFLICFLLFMNSRTPFITAEMLRFDTKAILLLFSIGAVIIVFCVQKLDKAGSVQQNCKVYTKARLNFFGGNKDVLYVCRSNAMIEPIVMVFLAGVMSFALKETLEDMLLTNMISFSYVFSDIYIKLLKYENKRHTLLYPQDKVKYIRVEKIKNTVFIVLPIILVLCVPLSFVTSLESALVSGLISTVLFIINAFAFKINIEKQKGYHAVVTDRECLWFSLTYGVEILLISAGQTALFI